VSADGRERGGEPLDLGVVSRAQDARDVHQKLHLQHGVISLGGL
jgi:hypothetical protein